MSKGYFRFKIEENNLNIKKFKINEISFVNSRYKELIFYIKPLELDDMFFEELEKIKKLASKVENDILIQFKYEKNIDVEFEIDDVILFIYKLIRYQNNMIDLFITDFNYKISKDKIYIYLSNGMKNIDKIESYIKNMYEKYLVEIFNIKYDIKINSEYVEIELEEKEEIIVDNFKFEIRKDEKNNKIEKKSAFKQFKKNKLEVSNLSIISHLEEGEKVCFQGKIFYLDIKETKNNKVRLSIYITDNKNSIACNIVVNSISDFVSKVGDYIEVEGTFTRGDLRFNPTGEYYLQTYRVDLLDKKDEIRRDNAEKKRIELSIHTQMSEMISTINPHILSNWVIDFGHNAMAVTDYGVVHAFPFLPTKNPDFKIIYGIEAYVVDDTKTVIINPIDKEIEEANFVIFDIETTGFNPDSDKIIEIGAIKLRNGKIIDRFSEFVNPEMLIPKKIIELTNINDEMVKNSDTIEKVLPRFLEFSKDSIYVAHNAKFDIGFIKKNSDILNLDFNPSYIDTITWAKILLDDMKSFNLKALAKKFNVNLENHHRAIDDAEATSNIFKNLLGIITSKGISNLKEITDKIQTNPKNADTENTTILVKNLKGLKRLYELVSISHLKYYGDKKPRILRTDLEKDRENLIISSSPVYSGRYNKGKLVDMYIRGMSKEEILEEMEFYDYVQIYPREVYNDAISQEEISGYDSIVKMNKDFVEMAYEKNKIVVATGNVYYLNEEDAKSKQALAFGSDKAFKTFMIDTKNYFRTTSEMLEEFSYLGDKADDIVINNTHIIADMIEKIKPIPDGVFRPIMKGSEDEVRDMTYNKAYEIYGNPLPDAVKKRVDRELNSIINNGFSVLYLIAQKLVKKSVDNGYLVGSRGSVGSSLVAFLMGITEVNALYPHYICNKCKYFEMIELEGSGVDLEEKNCPNCNTLLKRDGHSIPFEVFMGFKGDKTPDIDLNFSGEYQGEIHKYTKELFGEDYVFRAGTISTLAEKNAFTNSKKYFEDLIVKDFENEIYRKYNQSLKKLDYSTREKEERVLNDRLNNFYSRNKAEILRVSKKTEGARKTTGQHPGGMIVVPNYKSIYDFTPVQYPANDESSGSIITHFDYHVMDQQLVKLDILGHDDPTTLRMLQDLTNVDIYNIPLNDKKVLSIFSSTEALGVTEEEINSKIGTNGIPEFGTDFVKRMLEETKPKTFAELVRISGLSHGTDVWTNNAQDYVREGIATLSEIITVRDDIMIRLIDKGMDNTDAFNIMEFVRKGMPSKNKEKWEEYKKLMENVNIKKWYIESCEKIQYMFPKGHAVAYVMMAVRIAYFKIYYPLEFYTALLNRKVSDYSFELMGMEIKGLKEGVNKIKEGVKGVASVLEKKQILLMEILIEMLSRNISLLPIDIYKSEADKFVIEDGKIRIPLIGMDGLGETVAYSIVKERKIKEFTSIEDFVKRTKASKTLIQLLKKYGSINPNMPESNQLSLF